MGFDPFSLPLLLKFNGFDPFLITTRGTPSSTMLRLDSGWAFGPRGCKERGVHIGLKLKGIMHRKRRKGLVINSNNKNSKLRSKCLKKYIDNASTMIQILMNSRNYLCHMISHRD